MTPQNFKKIARLLKEAYAELEQQAKVEGIPLVSPEYDTLVEKVRDGVFREQGVTKEEYEKAKEEQTAQKQEGKTAKEDRAEKLLSQIEKIKGEKGDKGDKGDQGEQGESIVGPRGPKGERGDKGEKGDRGPEGKEGKRGPKGEDGMDGLDADVEPIMADLREVQSSHLELYERVEALPKEDELAERVQGAVLPILKKDMDLLGMPNFRKLGMGLQDQIDHRVIGASDNQTTPKLTVSTTAPTNPKLYDLWVQI